MKKKQKPIKPSVYKFFILTLQNRSNFGQFGQPKEKNSSILKELVSK